MDLFVFSCLGFTEVSFRISSGLCRVTSSASVAKFSAIMSSSAFSVPLFSSWTMIIRMSGLLLVFHRFLSFWDLFSLFFSLGKFCCSSSNHWFYHSISTQLLSISSTFFKISVTFSFRIPTWLFLSLLYFFFYWYTKIFLHLKRIHNYMLKHLYALCCQIILTSWLISVLVSVHCLFSFKLWLFWFLLWRIF